MVRTTQHLLLAGVIPGIAFSAALALADGHGRMMGVDMMWGLGLLWLLLVVVLVLAAAALVKYLRSERTK